MWAELRWRTARLWKPTRRNMPMLGRDQQTTSATRYTSYLHTCHVCTIRCTSRGVGCSLSTKTPFVMDGSSLSHQIVYGSGCWAAVSRWETCLASVVLSRCFSITRLAAAAADDSVALLATAGSWWLSVVLLTTAGGWWLCSPADRDWELMTL